MASFVSVAAKALNIKGMHIDSVDYVEGAAQMNGEEYRRDVIVVHARPYKKLQGRCPECGRKCPTYDHQAKAEVAWRANSLNGVPIVIMYQPVRVECPGDGVLTEGVPWSDGGSHFTVGFDDEVAFLALTCPKTVVSQFMGINWRTVGNCVKAAHARLEPDVTARLRGLRRICVDETSYRRGQKYVTVVYDMDRNRVAWLHEGHGLKVFEEFCEALTEEERGAMEVVAGDGAQWIDQCVERYFENARRCVDFFHVVGWANEKLDKVRNSARARADTDVRRMRERLAEAEAAERAEIREVAGRLGRAREELEGMPRRGRPSKRKLELEGYIGELERQLEKLRGEAAPEVGEGEYRAALAELATMPRRGRPSKRKAELTALVAAYEGAAPAGGLSAEHREELEELERRARDIRGTKYALGMNPENLSASLQDKLRLVEESYPDVYEAYRLKEELRVILHMRDHATARAALGAWVAEAGSCGIAQFEELAEKVARHAEGILAAVELQVNSSKSEATNTTVKALIATARGFRNLDNMFALVYLRCSDIVIPLNNRYQPSAAKQRELRDVQNARKRAREEAKRKAYEERRAS